MAWVCNYEAKNTNNSRATPDPPSRAGDASVVGRRGLLARLTNYTKFHIKWLLIEVAFRLPNSMHCVSAVLRCLPMK